MDEIVRPVRIIPARAGFTPCIWRPSGAAGDHPRSRGVYLVVPARCGGSRGSSPLARGLRLRLGARRALRGIIPARAGFTFSILPTHPHACGSSPLARGLLSHPMTAPRRVRIIPARAGFTQGVYEAVLRARDHPRSRGVYEAAPSRVSVRVGSSPLARGLPGWMWSARLRVRIIPARAGFTPPSSSTWPMRGSSPLARGLRVHRSQHHHHGRIIPARAGFTPPSTRTPCP